MIYFASDTHLGLCYDKIDSKQKERFFVDWLKSLDDCTELFLLGDIFDYWFEYSRVIPKGFSRLFGQLALMSDNGVVIHYLPGNHDLWLNDYFTEELGIKIHYGDFVLNIRGKKVLLSHGDALSGMTSFLGKIFRSRSLRWLFQRLIHPDLSIKFGYWWSLRNRRSRSLYHEFKGEDERLVISARRAISKNSDLDYIICGHIHIPLIYDLNSRTKLVILGQWVVGRPHIAVMNEIGEVCLKEI